MIKHFLFSINKARVACIYSVYETEQTIFESPERNNICDRLHSFWISFKRKFKKISSETITFVLMVWAAK